MLEKNYTNPEGRARFGFSASGKYRAPHKLTGVAVGIAVAASMAAVLMISFSIAALIREEPAAQGQGMFFMSMTGGLTMLISGIVIIGTAIMVIKYILQGFWCSYFADEEKFTATIGGTPHTIYYKEVQAVHFEPRMMHGVVRGYDVTIKINGVYEEFAIVADNYIAENSTPFYIIKERVELLRIAEERERVLKGTTDVVSSVSPKEKRDAMQDAMERLEDVLGKDAEMPGISVKGTALPDIARRVSPTVNGYADDLPAVGADGEPIRSAETYVTGDGMAHNINDVVAQGNFRVLARKKTTVLVGIIAVIAWIGLYLLVKDIYSWGYFPVGKWAAILVAPFTAVTLINYMRNGRSYNYRANGREFVITSKGMPEEHFYYNEVQSVNYKKFAFLWVKGYKVEILTRYGITKYNFVFPGFGKLQPTRNLPFEIIRERIEQK